MPSPAEALGSLSIIIPAFNAARVIESTLRDITAWLASASSTPALPASPARPDLQGRPALAGCVLTHELILVDDGSTDDTVAIARRAVPAITVHSLGRNRGKGAAVRHGMLSSRSNWALFMDADNSTAIHHLDRFIPQLPQADVLIASRRVSGARIVRRQPRIRQAMGRTFPHIVRRVALPGISDTQCGFKLFRQSAVRAIFPLQQVERFAFDVEVLLIARKLGLRIVEVPVDWDNPANSTVRIHTDTIRMLLDVLRSTRRLRRLSPQTAASFPRYELTPPAPSPA